MLSFLSGIGGKIVAGFAAAGLFLVGILKIMSNAKKAERNRIELASKEEEVRILKGRKEIHDQVQSDGPDAAFERMRKRAARKRDD